MPARKLTTADDERERMTFKIHYKKARALRKEAKAKGMKVPDYLAVLVMQAHDERKRADA